MAGTIEGGKKAAATNKKKYGADFYSRMGQIGGKLGKTGGFAANRTLSRTAGALGGKVSKKGYKLLKVEDNIGFYEHKESGKLVRFTIQ